jgi:hypothetical protein
MRELDHSRFLAAQLFSQVHEVCYWSIISVLFAVCNAESSGDLEQMVQPIKPGRGPWAATASLIPLDYSSEGNVGAPTYKIGTVSHGGNYGPAPDTIRVGTTGGTGGGQRNGTAAKLGVSTGPKPY